MPTIKGDPKVQHMKNFFHEFSLSGLFDCFGNKCVVLMGLLVLWKVFKECVESVGISKGIHLSRMCQTVGILVAYIAVVPFDGVAHC